MGQLSKIAKNSWNKESQNVKDFYNKLSEDAKSLYRQNTIQIVLDKHMNEHMDEIFTTTTTNNSTFSSTYPITTSSFSSITSNTNESNQVDKAPGFFLLRILSVCKFIKWISSGSG